MLLNKYWQIVGICILLLCKTLYSQINIQGTVLDNGSEPVQNALVELTDQVDVNRIFSSYTNEQGEFSITVTETAIPGIPAQKPKTFRLLQNYPNPFNPSTVINFEIPHPAYLRIEIYNILGQKIKTLFDGMQTNLYGRVVWDATNDQNIGVAAGVYFYSLCTKETRITHKMLLLDGHMGNTAKTGTGSLPEQLFKSLALYTLKVSGTDFLTWMQKDVQITPNMYFDVSVTRTVTDIDGNVYTAVKIGTQWWMAANLKVQHYRNGDLIPNVEDNTEWSALTNGAYCGYNNIDVNKTGAGALYNWYALADNRNIAPQGWHVPSDAEWQNLIDYLGGYTIACGKLKETGLDHWNDPNFEATNTSGFTALSGGYRNPIDGTFTTKGFSAYFWSATESSEMTAWGRKLLYIGVDVMYEQYLKQQGCSVRLIKDYAALPITPIPNSPVNGAADVFNNINLKWSPVDGVARYSLQIATDAEFYNLVLDMDNIADAFFQVDSLADSTLYYWRVKAVSESESSAWSEPFSFTTTVLRTGTVTDIDGNIYKTVKIGRQWWMAENLKVTHYRNGEPIYKITDFTEWSLKRGAFSYYDYDDLNAVQYGALYNNYAVIDSQSIAPEGWHIPTYNEWRQLEMCLGMSETECDVVGNHGADEGGKLKARNSEQWLNPNTGATNESGFTALPGGYCHSNGVFENLGKRAYFVTLNGNNQNYILYQMLYYDRPDIFHQVETKGGYSVRCVKD